MSTTTQVPSAHGFSFRHVLTKALVKQGGYTRFHLAIVSFLKAQMRILPKATTSTSLNVILGQITKAKKGKGRKKKKKKWEGGVGLYPNKTCYQKLVYPLRCLKMKHLAVEDVLNQLLRALSFKKIIGPNNLRVKDTLSFPHPVQYL